jgi:Kef-type K+ transport system membrane component KefB/mannitol/fructose-specific phosphotransferase system IIA component (Ntr-type)
VVESSVLPFLLATALLLGVARLFGELARALRLPTVAGELLAGVVLGPTCLGRLAPHAFHWTFEGAAPLLGGYTTFAVVLLLVVSGLEVDLGIVRRRGAAVASVTALATLIPFAAGIALGLTLPGAGAGATHPERVSFALFLGVALAISALPVLARTLHELGLFKTDIGLLVMAAATVTDVLAWLGFSVLVGPVGHGAVDGRHLVFTAVVALVFLVIVLGPGRRAIDDVVGKLEQTRGAPERILSILVVVALLGAAAAQAIGLHAVFGGFVTGVIVGGSKRLRERTRAGVQEFVTSIFAPIFFASVGLRVDFAQALDARLVVLVVLVAIVSKVAGGALGARVAGMRWREAAAVGVGLTSRGAMGIVLAVVALDAHLVDAPMFAALVAMALVTSALSGPSMRVLLHHAHEEDVIELLRRGAFVHELDAVTPAGAIEELTGALHRELGDLASTATRTVLAREREAPTALGEEVAIPHAALEGLKTPLLALGLSRRGIDFDAPDGLPVRIVFLLLMPPRAYEEEVRVLASIARSIFDARAREALLEAEGFDAAARALDENARRVEQAHPAQTPRLAGS